MQTLNTSPNTTALAAAWRLFVASAADYATVSTPWHYDLVDITRQALSNLFYDVAMQYESAYDSCAGQLLDTYTMFNNTDSREC